MPMVRVSNGGTGFIGSESISDTNVHTYTLGSKPKQVVTIWKYTSDSKYIVSVYDERISTTQYIAQTTGSEGYITLFALNTGSAANARIFFNITNTGFTWKDIFGSMGGTLWYFAQ